MKKRREDKADWIKVALERYEHRLVRHAVRITGDPELARDIVQDTFLRLCRANREEVQGHLAAWLYTVCRNRALDVTKKEGRMGRLFDFNQVADVNPDGNPGDVASKNQVHSLVREIVGTLPEDQQEAFLLKFQDELTYREISRVTGKSLGTVSKLLSTALAEIRNRLRLEVDLAREG